MAIINLAFRLRFYRQFMPKKLQAAANRVTLKDIGLLALAVGCAFFGLKGFLLPAGFLDGGVTGIALIARQITDFQLAPLLFLINIPFILMGRYQISMIFAVKSLAAISCLALCLWLIRIPPVTLDPLLVSVFGGFFLGLGIGLAIRGGGVVDGTEVLALYLARQTGFTIGHVVFMINVVIFALAATVFNVETALYAMLTYLSAYRTVDFILHGLDEYTAMQIFSEKNSAILYKILTRSLKLKVTVFKGSRGDPDKPEKANDRPVLYLVVSRLQVQQILATINSIDPRAEVAYHAVTDYHGKI
jgi:uncharacterized membrane-anchored protein YitT (DUF2179 family)